MKNYRYGALSFGLRPCRNTALSIYAAASVLYMELVLRLATTSAKMSFFSLDIVYITLFSASIGALFAIICSLFTEKVNRRIFIAVEFFVSILCVSQIIYYGVFGYYYVLSSVANAGQVLQFWYQTLLTVFKKIVFVILCLAPPVLYIIFGKRVAPSYKTYAMPRIILAVIAVVTLAGGILGAVFNTSGDISPKLLYEDMPDNMYSVKTFGALTAIRLDFKFLIFGTHQELDISDTPGSLDDITSSGNSSAVSDTSSADELQKPEEPQYNRMNIDFDTLIKASKNDDVKSLSEYFSSLTPTKKNSYSAMFKGKNIITITAEGFYRYAVNKELTPTLYKMAHSGLEFTNFYTPGWGVSTIDGEYVNTLSLIPKSGVWSLYRSSENNLYFSLGNATRRLGYDTFAYHDHTFDYYHRDSSHPNLGYDYKGIGNGLELEHNTWPNSDIEMIDATVPEYVNKDKFCVYYMTVSGHMLYTFGGNYISSKNKELVDSLPYSEGPKAYLACQIELDRAMQRLLEKLEAEGVLNNTIIVLSADHYPYGLDDDQINELAGEKLDTNFERYHNALIIYNPGFEHTVIDKPCCALDILPTVLNMCGIEYDSRLLMGTDIMSDSQGLVIFSNRSWITEYGRYNSQTKRFTPNEGVTVSDNYVDSVCSVVSKKFSASTMVLDTDYYAIVFGKNPNK